jgi:rubrerythrin
MEQVIAFAVEREDTAYKLYSRAAEISANPSAKKMFLELAQEEATHKDVFARIDADKLDDLKVCKLPEATIGQYLKDVPFRPDMNYQEILTFALKAEESAYQLYKAAAGATDNQKLQKTLLAFAEVELAHRRKIESLYDEHVLTEG